MIPTDHVTLGYLNETASQTAGPYVHIGLIPTQAGFDIFESDLGATMLRDDTPGERVRIEGRILDGTGGLVRDALIEIWQADSEGRYADAATQRTGFRGWGRVGTDFETGVWGFDTIKPGRVPGRLGHKRMAPHASLWIVARGINIGLNTRLYFADEEAANAEDPVLRMIEPAERRATLVAARSERDGRPVYTLDVRLQGEGETVFFDV